MPPPASRRERRWWRGGVEIGAAWEDVVATEKAMERRGAMARAATVVGLRATATGKAMVRVSEGTAEVAMEMVAEMVVQAMATEAATEVEAKEAVWETRRAMAITGELAMVANVAKAEVETTVVPAVASWAAEVRVVTMRAGPVAVAWVAKATAVVARVVASTVMSIQVGVMVQVAAREAVAGAVTGMAKAVGSGVKEAAKGKVAAGGLETAEETTARAPSPGVELLCALSLSTL